MSHFGGPYRFWLKMAGAAVGIAKNKKALADLIAVCKISRSHVGSKLKKWRMGIDSQVIYARSPRLVVSYGDDFSAIAELGLSENDHLRVMAELGRVSRSLALSFKENTTSGLETRLL